MTWTSDASAPISLPAPHQTGPLALEAVLARRRTRRHYAADPLTWEEIGQLLWAADGITDPPTGKRTAPSAGARHPLVCYAALPEGLFRYRPETHSLVQVAADDLRRELAMGSGQEFMSQAPCIIAITAVYQRTTERYGQRGRDRYVPMDVGHAAQNVLLQATALGLASCPVGAFQDQQVAVILRLPPEETPLYFLPVGREAGP